MKTGFSLWYDQVWDIIKTRKTDILWVPILLHLLISKKLAQSVSFNWSILARSNARPNYTLIPLYIYMYIYTVYIYFWTSCSSDLPTMSVCRVIISTFSDNSLEYPSLKNAINPMVVSHRSESYHVALLRLRGAIHGDAVGWWCQLRCVWLDKAPSVDETVRRKDRGEV